VKTTKVKEHQAVDEDQVLVVLEKTKVRNVFSLVSGKG
jgi:hypothetical protein